MKPDQPKKSSASSPAPRGSALRNPSKPLQRRYSPDDLHAMWSFCRHDFTGLVELMVWLDGLPETDQQEQLDAAHSLPRKS